MAYNGNINIPQLIQALGDNNPWIPGASGLGDLFGRFPRPDFNIFAPFQKPTSQFMQALGSLQHPNLTVQYDTLPPTLLPVTNTFDLAGVGGGLTTQTATVPVGQLRATKSSFTYKEIESALRPLNLSPNIHAQLIFAAHVYNAMMSLANDGITEAYNYLISQRATPLPNTNPNTELTGFATAGLDRTFSPASLNFFLAAIKNEYEGQKFDIYGKTPVLLHTASVENHALYDMLVGNADAGKLKQQQMFNWVTVKEGLNKIAGADLGLALAVPPNAYHYTSYTMPQIGRENNFDFMSSLSDAVGFNVGSPDTFIIPDVAMPRMGMDNMYQPDMKVSIIIRSTNFDSRASLPSFQERAFDVNTEVYVAMRNVFYRSALTNCVSTYRQIP